MWARAIYSFLSLHPKEAFHLDLRRNPCNLHISTFLKVYAFVLWKTSRLISEKPRWEAHSGNMQTLSPNRECSGFWLWNKGDEGNLTGIWLGLRTGLLLGNTWAESFLSFDPWPEKKQLRGVCLPVSRGLHFLGREMMEEGTGPHSRAYVSRHLASYSLALGQYLKSGALERERSHSPQQSSRCGIVPEVLRWPWMETHPTACLWGVAAHKLGLCAVCAS